MRVSKVKTPPPPGFVGVIDPAWAQDQGGGGHGANEHYELANVEDMAWQYRMSPPWRDTGPGLLFMWATTLSLCTNGHSAPHALARALDFRICASWVWAKIDLVDCSRCEGSGRGGLSAIFDCKTCDGTGKVFAHPEKFGMGQYQVTEHEFLFLCRRGDFDPEQYDAIRKVRDRSVIYAPRVTKTDSKEVLHSAKPERAWTQTILPVTKAAFPDVRLIEFNARVRRKGCSAYGRLHGEKLPNGEPAPLVYEIGDD